MPSSTSQIKHNELLIRLSKKVSFSNVIEPCEKNSPEEEPVRVNKKIPMDRRISEGRLHLYPERGVRFGQNVLAQIQRKKITGKKENMA
jgi:hypothetical protein